MRKNLTVSCRVSCNGEQISSNFHASTKSWNRGSFVQSLNFDTLKLITQCICLMTCSASVFGNATCVVDKTFKGADGV